MSGPEDARRALLAGSIRVDGGLTRTPAIYFPVVVPPRCAIRLIVVHARTENGPVQLFLAEHDGIAGPVRHVGDVDNALRRPHDQAVLPFGLVAGIAGIVDLRRTVKEAGRTPGR